LAEAHFHLGNALWKARRPGEAGAALRRSIELGPGSAAAHNSLGLALIAEDRIDEGIAAFRRAIELKPGMHETYINLGNALSSAGMASDALEAFGTAANLSNDPAAWDNVLFSINYVPGVTVEKIREEHERWVRQAVAPKNVAVYRSHGNDRTPGRRLRVGYVSPDFNAHPVVRFFLPLLENHDRQSVEVFCYSNVAMADAQTEKIKPQADGWRAIRGVGDGEVAEMIRRDAIDILMDLSLHGEGNRLGVFAMKPAPVQATWLGYVGTTGLGAIDYRLSDPYLDEPGHDPHFVERTIRLRRSFWCYQQPSLESEQRPTPAATNGYATFGCFNNYAKVNVEVLGVWARILAALPGSRIIIHSRPGSHRDRALAMFAAAGVEAARVRFVGFMLTEHYMRLHHEIDIALDPFPFGGGTTSCDALFMGVPLVTLKGATGAGRAGTTLLSNMGLGELIARSTDEYASIAKSLAGDVPRLVGLHGELRERMRRSPLMDARGFALDMEAVLRAMWERWCEGR